MEPQTIGLIAIPVFVILVVVPGVPIGLSMGVVGIAGLAVLKSTSAAGALYIIPWGSVASWTISVLPMFIMMGSFTEKFGFGSDAYDFSRKWLGHLPGGLGLATLLAGGMFGACTGSSAAATATLGKMSLPEMLRYKYDTSFACGIAVMGGTLAALIPPSVTLVIYAVITEQSAGKLQIAGLVPGVLCMAAYMALVFIRATLQPWLAPRAERVGWMERLRSLKSGVVAVGALFVLVIGGLFTGIFTPTEAGAVGAFACLIIALFRKRFTLTRFRESVTETLQTTCAIFLIIIGAYIFITFLASTKLPIIMAQWIVTLPIGRMAIFGVIVLMYLVLGCFLEAIGMMLLTVPFIYPSILALGFDPIWFGVVLVKLIEIGLITPPVGLQTFILKMVAPPQVTIAHILRGFVPFFILDLFGVLGLLVAFPQIVTFLPDMMR